MEIGEIKVVEDREDEGCIIVVYICIFLIQEKFFCGGKEGFSS